MKVMRKIGKFVWNSLSGRLFPLNLALSCVIIITGCEESKKEVTTALMPEVDGGLYDLEFVFIKDADKFTEYSESITALIELKKAKLVLSILPSQVWAKDDVKPDIVNLVYYESSASREMILNDKSYLALAELRDEAIVKLTVSGQSIVSEAVPGKTKNRSYMVEFVQYRDGDSSAYDEYVKFATTVMERHGYHLEHVIKPIASSGISQPDLIRVMYFDSQEQLEQMEKDQDFAKMMKLYETSVVRSFWILGKTSPDVGPIQEFLGKG